MKLTTIINQGEIFLPLNNIFGIVLKLSATKVIVFGPVIFKNYSTNMREKLRKVCELNQ